MNTFNYLAKLNIFFNNINIKILSLHEKKVIPIILCLIFITLFFRNSAAIYPGLLDEFYYNQYARLLPLSEAKYGNFLYYFIYRVTNSCENGFLSCTYFLNSGFYLAAFFPIYAIARAYCHRGIALWISFLAILGPFNFWTAFFMPESLYFLIFWIYIWGLVFFRGANEYIRWLVLGAVLGICAAVKIHAFFLLPASCLYIIYLAFHNSSMKLKNSITHLFCFVAAAVIAKFAIGFMLAGVAGLTLFGVYGGMISHTSDALSSMTSAAQSVELDPRFTPSAILKREGSKAVWINVLPIFLLYAPVLVVLLAGLIKNTAINGGEQKKAVPRKDFMMLSFLIITSLVTIITFYQLILISKMMGAAELYWRYYEFSFPLLYLVAAASLENRQIIKKNSRLFLLLMTAIAMFLVIWALYRGAGTEWISLGKVPAIFYISGSLSIFILGLSLIRPIWALRIFIWIALPFILITSNFALYHHLQKTRITPNDSNVGQFINSRLSKDDLAKLVVVQNNNLTQTVPMMYFNHAPIEFISISESQKQFDLALLPPGKDWVLLMGNHELVGEAMTQTHQEFIQFGGLTLFGGHGNISIDFKNAAWRGLVAKQTGLYNPPEPWGAWSIGDTIKLEFVKPLPRKFNIILNARAFGPNTNLDFVLKIGSQAIPFKVNAYPEFVNVIIPVENHSRLNIIEINIPKPISPKELGIGDDTRRLGLGLTQLQIQW